MDAKDGVFICIFRVFFYNYSPDKFSTFFYYVKHKCKCSNYSHYATFISVNSGGSDSEDDWDSAVGGSFGESGRESDDLGWDSASSWSTGLTKDHFDGVASVSQRTTSSSTDSGKADGDGRKIDTS
ncbi:hypothetical protein NC652_037458 [Populus alba x Populus x berolinensis]|nr:hypothetical protein NC652_037458 [Populus alba x Populus x berolinensis]